MRAHLVDWVQCHRACDGPSVHQGDETKSLSAGRDMEDAALPEIQPSE